MRGYNSERGIIRIKILIILKVVCILCYVISLKKICYVICVKGYILGNAVKYVFLCKYVHVLNIIITC